MIFLSMSLGANLERVQVHESVGPSQRTPEHVPKNVFGLSIVGVGKRL